MRYFCDSRRSGSPGTAADRRGHLPLTRSAVAGLPGGRGRGDLAGQRAAVAAPSTTGMLKGQARPTAQIPHSAACARAAMPV